MQIIKTEYITIDKSSVTKNRLLAAIDIGFSLTKILFLNKNNKDQLLNDNTSFVTLDYHLFDNIHLESVLKYLKSNAYQLEKDDYKIHVTGALAIMNKSRIEEILKTDVILIDEFITIAEGHKFVLEHMEIEKLITPAVTIEGYGKMESSFVEKFAESIAKKLQVTEPKNTLSKFPCLFHVHGATSGCFYFDENGVSDYFGIINHGGKTFLGLAKCLLDTNDFDEVVDLASRGTRTTVDTMVSEMFDENIDSPYGKLPPDLPMFPFGKCGDHDKGLEDLKKEDVASSLVAFQAFGIAMFCSQVAVIKKISKVYLSGNLFKSNLFEKEIRQIISIFPLGVEFNFLNFGYFGTLGAMLNNKVGKSFWK